MKMWKKISLTAVIICLVLFTMWSAANSDHLASFPDILSSFYAKEACSCMYVVGQDEEFCKNYARSWLPVESFEHDPEARTVTVTGKYIMYRTNTARYIDERYGCVLVNESQ
ncbi:MAG: hypothetical protein KDK30_10730 [Leptospiraceae bacterium]|nr:hypothetical protein [Leptospiraceae bacterium]MCB1314963.1 hypothetical protein [Leptospiraceae bacterium]MCB1322728.1 hypothetical protein [Leptospiraceae bacterium]